MQQMEVSDYVNEPPGPKKKGGGDAKQTERRLCQVVLLSFGLLCVIQAILNVSLRLTLDYTPSDCNTTHLPRQDQVKNVQKDCEGVLPGHCNILQEQFNALTRDRNLLENRNTELTNTIRNLQEERRRMRTNLGTAQGGWEYFSGSFYHISSITKTWQGSRDDCLQKGADLVIINSKEEQDFLRKFQKIMWIGLTDSETEGTWKWVDGTPLTKSYWDTRKPNGGKRENCGLISNYYSENSWNDKSCSNSVYWICERKVGP